MAILKLHKKIGKGATTYRQDGSRIPVNFGKEFFVGEPPAEFELNIPNIHAPYRLDADAKKAERDAAKAAKAAEKQAAKDAKQAELAAKKAAVEAKKAAAAAEREAKKAAAAAEREAKKAAKATKPADATVQ